MDQLVLFVCSVGLDAWKYPRAVFCGMGFQVGPAAYMQAKQAILSALKQAHTVLKSKVDKRLSDGLAAVMEERLRTLLTRT